MKQVDIKGFENYQITDDGRVWSKNTNKWKTKKLNNNGYYLVNLWKNGKQKWILIHRLVGEAFIPNKENKPTINHKNHIRTDNRVENLEWATKTEQMDGIAKKKLSDSLKGRKLSEKHRMHLSEAMKGEKHPMYGEHHTEEAKKKMSVIKMKKVYQYKLNGELVKIWNSTMECEKEGFNQGHVASCCRGVEKLHKGYIWSYKPLY